MDDSNDEGCGSLFRLMIEWDPIVVRRMETPTELGLWRRFMLLTYLIRAHRNPPGIQEYIFPEGGESDYLLDVVGLALSHTHLPDLDQIRWLFDYVRDGVMPRLQHYVPEKSRQFAIQMLTAIIDQRGMLEGGPHLEFDNTGFLIGAMNVTIFG